MSVIHLTLKCIHSNVPIVVMVQTQIMCIVSIWVERARTKIEEAFQNQIPYYDFEYAHLILCICQFSKFKSKVNSVNLNKFHPSILFETTKQKLTCSTQKLFFSQQPIIQNWLFQNLVCRTFSIPADWSEEKTNWTRDNGCEVKYGGI